MRLFFKWGMKLEDMVQARVARYLLISGDTEINRDW